MTTIEQFEALTRELKRLGCDASVSISIQIPVIPLGNGPEPVPAQQQIPVATNATLMWALNRLKAAAGQPNRDAIRKFLYYRGWIGPTDAPEQWNLNNVPTTKEQLLQMAGDFATWEQEAHKPAAAA